MIDMIGKVKKFSDTILMVIILCLLIFSFFKQQDQIDSLEDGFIALSQHSLLLSAKVDSLATELEKFGWDSCTVDFDNSTITWIRMVFTSE